MNKKTVKIMLRYPDRTDGMLCEIPAIVLDDCGLCIHKGYHLVKISDLETTRYECQIDYKPKYMITHINTGYHISKFTFAKLKTAKSALAQIKEKIQFNWNEYNDTGMLASAYFKNEDLAKTLYQIYLDHMWE
jgi:hypothetical protein